MKTFWLSLLSILALGILVAPAYAITISSTTSTIPSSTTTVYPLCSTSCPYGEYYSGTSPSGWYCYATSSGGQGAACTYSYATTTTTVTTSITSTYVTTNPTTTVGSGSPNALNLNSTWAQNFFKNISTTRGDPYYECSSLDQFGTTRFNTMVKNYGISHYGYNADLDNFSQRGYGTYAEEVLYPSGYTPSGYISYITATAPLHYQLLLNDTLTYFGYHIQNGPGFLIHGPNGGQCAVTEIPGPNINITQYFAQYGCTLTVTNETWFVLELSSYCSNTQSTTSSSTSTSTSTTVPTTSLSTSTTTIHTTTLPTTTIQSTITTTTKSTTTTALTTSTTTISGSGLTKPIISPQNPSVAEGQAVSFNVSVSGGTPPYTYYWYVGSSSNCASDTSIAHASTSPVYFTYIYSTQYYCVKVYDSATNQHNATSAADFVSVGGATSVSTSTASSTSYVTTTLPSTTVQTTSVPTSTTTKPTTTVQSTVSTTTKATTTLSTTVPTTTISGSGLTTPTISPQNPSLSSGQTITLTASISGGTPPYTYYWYAGYSPNCASDTSVVHVSTTPTYFTYAYSALYYCVEVVDSSSVPNTAISAADFLSVGGATSIPTTTTVPVNARPLPSANQTSITQHPAHALWDNLLAYLGRLFSGI